jgi:hypothetical protein
MQLKQGYWKKAIMRALIAGALITGFISCSSSGAGSSGTGSSDTDSSTVQTPVMKSESYMGITLVTISCPTSGATVRYTKDGTDPTDASPLYADTLPIFKTTTVKARAMKAGLTQSEIAVKAVTIDNYTHKTVNGTPYCVKNGVSTALPLPPSAATGYTNCMGTADNGDVYIFGRTEDSSHNGTPCYWLNGTYQALPMPSDAVSGNTYTGAIIKGNDYYVHGSTKNASGISSPCYWKTGKYNALPVDLASYGGSVNDGILVGDDGSVYVTGSVYNSSKNTIPCYWKNGVKTNLFVPSGCNGTANNISVSGSDVYVSGVYNYGGNDYNKPCLWKNGSIQYLSATQMYQASGSIYCGYCSGTAFISGSDVYVGGYSFQYYMDARGWTMSPVYWKNGLMVTLSLPSYENVSGGVWGFKVMNGKVVPFGTYTCANGYGSCYWPEGVCVDGLYSYQ